MASSLQDIRKKYATLKQEKRRFDILKKGRGRDIFNLYFLQPRTQVEICGLLYNKKKKIPKAKSRLKIKPKSIPYVGYHTKLFEEIGWISPFKHNQFKYPKQNTNGIKLYSRRGYYVNDRVIFEILEECYGINLDKKSKMFILSLFSQESYISESIIKKYIVESYNNVVDGIMHLLRDYNNFKIIYYLIKRKHKDGYLYKQSSKSKRDLYEEFTNLLMLEQAIWSDEILPNEDQSKKIRLKPILEEDYLYFWDQVTRGCYSKYINYQQFKKAVMIGGRK